MRSSNYHHLKGDATTMKRHFIVDQKNFIINESKYRNPSLRSFPFANDSLIYFHPAVSVFGAALNVLIFRFFSTGLAENIADRAIGTLIFQGGLLLFALIGILFFVYNGFVSPLWLLSWRIRYHFFNKKNQIAETSFRMKDDLVLISFTTKNGRTHSCFLGLRVTVLYQDVTKPTVYFRNSVVIIPGHLLADYIDKMLDDFFPTTDPC